MYLLAPAAFVVWAGYMNEPVRELSPTTIDQGWATFILILAVFFIPALDQALGFVFPRRKP
jgi:hypothetical protein